MAASDEVQPYIQETKISKSVVPTEAPAEAVHKPCLHLFLLPACFSKNGIILVGTDIGEMRASHSKHVGCRKSIIPRVEDSQELGGLADQSTWLEKGAHTHVLTQRLLRAQQKFSPPETRPWSQHSVMSERQKQNTHLIRVDTNQGIDLSFNHQPLYYFERQMWEQHPFTSYELIKEKTFLPLVSLVAQMVKSLCAVQETQV